MRYQITYKGKKYISIVADEQDAQDAFAKFANRKVYGGNTIIGNYVLKQYDADTRGIKWAQFKCGWPSEAPFFCLCEKVKS